MCKNASSRGMCFWAHTSQVKHQRKSGTEESRSTSERFKVTMFCRNIWNQSVLQLPQAWRSQKQNKLHLVLHFLPSLIKGESDNTKDSTEDGNISPVLPGWLAPGFIPFSGWWRLNPGVLGFMEQSPALPLAVLLPATFAQQEYHWAPVPLVYESKQQPSLSLLRQHPDQSDSHSS